MVNFVKDRNTKTLTSSKNQPIVGPFGLPAASTIYKGLMYTLDSSGRPKSPGAVGEIVAGFSVQQIDNTGGANDALKCDLQTGPACWDGHAVNPPTIADLYRVVYASDNHTVSRLASDGSRAGILIGVDADGMWVLTGGYGIEQSALAGLNDSEDAITAFAGGGQANAYQLKARSSRVTTVATAADSVKLPVAVPGMFAFVANNAAANAMNVFPATGAQINALGANAAISIAANKGVVFFAVTATQWVSILTA
jgi:hypothetical protein